MTCYRSALWVAILLGWSSVCAANETTRRIFTVNAPLAHIAETLGGDEVQVIYLVPNGIDPAFWKPSSEDILLAQEAELILLNGAGYAKWVDTAVLPRSGLIDSSADFSDRLIAESADALVHQHGPKGEHSAESEFAFTTWFDPDLALKQLNTVAEALTVKWPELGAKIDAGRTEIALQIAEMDVALQNLFTTSAGRQIITSHPVYHYMERRYAQSFVSMHWEPNVMPDEEAWGLFEEQLDLHRNPLMIWEGKPVPPISKKLKQLGVEWMVISPFANVADRNSLFRKIARQVEPL